MPHRTFTASFGCPAFRGRVLGFGATQGASERWCLRSNRSARVVRRLPEWVNHPHLAARSQLRASERLPRARLCFELSSFSTASGVHRNFVNSKPPKQIAHNQENECVRIRVFRVLLCFVLLCCVVVLCCVVLCFGCCAVYWLLCCVVVLVVVLVVCCCCGCLGHDLMCVHGHATTVDAHSH